MGVVFTETVKAVIVEAPLDEAVKPADDVSMMVAKATEPQGSGKVTIYVYHPFFDVSTYHF
jgi:hypothetical protein